jgi:hypothetical protein
VVARDGERPPLAKQRHTLIRPGAVADEVAEAQHLLDLTHIPQDGLERGEVGVDVADKSDEQLQLPRARVASRLLLSYAQTALYNSGTDPRVSS